ncbi:conserved hypothetical protein [Xanthomonas citri pv. citri]|uniref:Uncharacterized protein n=1 Tax=Xanthomonas citri pv. citri TaxID=611301 RepID=A0A0U5FFQ1_XANCI|nr:conserved hypothetical protein [Xanthomonas citri pv. citri]CEE28407.1 conserved hypothetical protein [Xanthomonas citri pv. citri]CEE40345.1 conserved hypothetical protein [Xanthomonas citri pv. citri]CEE43424.1 conserved hypothetical protein [Xanthomonas citri pv. citri]CEE64693.1 conserved hypothetical protein [Xanthomonas citri pv. citri]
MRDRRTSDNPTGRPTVLRPLHPLRTRKCAQKSACVKPQVEIVEGSKAYTGQGVSSTSGRFARLRLRGLGAN